jgi:DnaJ-class molecular chaperone
VKWLILALAGLAGALYHAIACALFPYQACPRCGGSGRRRSPSGKHFGDCRRCKGTGRKLRSGRRFWIWVRAKRAGSSR